MPMRHSVEQIVAKLERAGDLVLNGATAAEAAAAVGVSENTYTRWQKICRAWRPARRRCGCEFEVDFGRLGSVVEETEGAVFSYLFFVRVDGGGVGHTAPLFFCTALKGAPRRWACC